MTRHHTKDESFLADLTDFLNELGDVAPSDAACDGTTDLLVDSTDLLKETEALLASYDSARGVPVPVVSTSVPTTLVESSSTAADDRKAVQNAQAAKRRLKYRTKLTKERHTLEEQEQILTKQLGHLQHTRKKPRPLQANNDDIPLWKAVATRQREGRVVAEEQRRRLKDAVDSRNSVISEIGEMMRQRLYGVKTPMKCEKSASANAVQLNTDDKALFEDYLQDLDLVYARTDEMFGACGVDLRPVISYRTGPERKFEGCWEFQDSLDVLLIPFTFEQTCSAMWQSMAHVHRQKDRSHYAGVVDPENTIAVKFRLGCSSTEGEPAALLVHLVMRRYVEAERMVLVWRALSDGEGAFSGMHSDETGWSIVRPNDVSDEEAVLFGTIMQTYVRFTPMNVPHGSSDQVTTDQFVKLVVTSVDEDAAEVGRMMDALLL